MIEVSGSTPSGEIRHGKTIRRMLALGFGLISTLSALMFVGFLILAIAGISLVDRLHQDELAIENSLRLATATREQYMHQAHWLLSREDKHLVHYRKWLEGIDDRIEVMYANASPKERAHLDRLSKLSREEDRLFQDAMVAAARRESPEGGELWSLHERAEDLTTQAAEEADAIVRSTERRVTQVHSVITRTTGIALAVGLACVAFILGLSSYFTRTLRKAVLEPLASLVHAAEQVGAGDFSCRVGIAGQGEFASVSAAFDRMAEELAQRERRLIQQERMAAIGQLAAGVAHEINNPIQVIRGFLKTMLPEARSECLREELQILDDEAADCQRLVEELVTYAGPSHLNLEAVALDQVVQAAVRGFAETTLGSDRQIGVSTEPHTQPVDGHRLKQVCLNLLFNAAQASPEKTTIKVKGRCFSSGYQVVIGDRGPGIPIETRSRIFEPFYTTKKDGSGLGLAVSKGIIEAHGGTIVPRDREGGGTEFVITLPRDSGKTGGREYA